MNLILWMGKPEMTKKSFRVFPSTSDLVLILNLKVTADYVKSPMIHIRLCNIGIKNDRIIKLLRMTRVSAGSLKERQENEALKEKGIVYGIHQQCT